MSENDVRFTKELMRINLLPIEETHDLVDTGYYDDNKWVAKKSWIALNNALKMASVNNDWEWYEKMKYHIENPGGKKLKEFKKRLKNE